MNNLAPSRKSFVKLIRLLFPEIYIGHFQLSIFRESRSLPKLANVVIFYVPFLPQILHKGHCIIVRQKLRVRQIVFIKL